MGIDRIRIQQAPEAQRRQRDIPTVNSQTSTWIELADTVLGDEWLRSASLPRSLARSLQTMWVRAVNRRLVCGTGTQNSWITGAESGLQPWACSRGRFMFGTAHWTGFCDHPLIDRYRTGRVE